MLVIIILIIIIKKKNLHLRLKPWSQIPLRTPYEQFFDHLRNGQKSFVRRSQGYLWPRLNPILTGGGSIWPPPLHEIRDCLAKDRDMPFHDFFLSSLAHLLIPSLRKSDRRSRGHVTFCTRTSAQNLPKICILHRFVYKTHGNYWFS